MLIKGVDEKGGLRLAVKEMLRKEIESGERLPGERIDGERTLAEKYEVSRWVVIEALKLLEAEGLIEKVPSRGVFVRRPEERREERKELFFFLPSDRIDEASMGFAEWIRYSELSSGVMSGARACGLDVKVVTREISLELVRSGALEKAAAAVFYSRLEDEMAQELSKRGVNCVITGPNAAIPGFSSVLYDREKAIAGTIAFIAASKRRSAGFILPLDGDSGRASSVKLGLELEGFSCPSEWIFKADHGNVEKAAKALATVLPEDPKKLPGTLYCERMTLALALMRVAFARGWRPGKDFKAIAITCRTAIQCICPELTFMRIPYFEMGEAVCALAARLEGSPAKPEHLLIDAELVEGASA